MTCKAICFFFLLIINNLFKTVYLICVSGTVELWKARFCMHFFFFILIEVYVKHSQWKLLNACDLLCPPVNREQMKFFVARVIFSRNIMKMMDKTLLKLARRTSKYEFLKSSTLSSGILRKHLVFLIFFLHKADTFRKFVRAL